MTNNSRLHEVQQTLVARGVQDVKFFFDSGSLSTLSPADVTSGVADFLDAYVCDRATIVERVGDRRITA
jgi:hypothetical protein